MNRKKALLVVLGVPVLLVAVAAGIGATLPVAHTASLSRSLMAPPERVWAVVTDPAGYPSWRPGTLLAYLDALESRLGKTALARRRLQDEQVHAGMPAPRYWHQQADHRIQVSLDTVTHSARRVARTS